MGSLFLDKRKRENLARLIDEDWKSRRSGSIDISPNLEYDGILSEMISAMREHRVSEDVNLNDLFIMFSMGSVYPYRQDNIINFRPSLNPDGLNVAIITWYLIHNFKVDLEANPMHLVFQGMHGNVEKLMVDSDEHPFLGLLKPTAGYDPSDESKRNFSTFSVVGPFHYIAVTGLAKYKTPSLSDDFFINFGTYAEANLTRYFIGR